MSVKPSSQASPCVRRSRPEIERLEVRDVPSATHLAVALSAGPVTAGGTVSVTVTALDDAGHTATDYTGTLQLTSSDPAAVLPGSYTFTTVDGGQHTFTVKLQTAGTPSILAADTAGGILTASATVSVVPAAVDHFAVQLVTGATAGQADSVTVIAQDAYGNTVTNYTGTVHFTTSDAQVQPPADVTFTTANNGTVTTNVTLDTAGAQTLTAMDGNGIHGSGSVTVAPGAATHFELTGPQNATVGRVATVTVVALDAFGNVATNYQGTVQLTLTDASGNSMASAVTHTFTTGDAGTTTMSIIPQGRGSLTFTVSDQADSSVSAQMGVTVQFATANQNYVDAVFQQLLGRDPTYAELIHYGSALDDGASRMAVVQQIEATSEYETDEITALYENLLGREPDQAGLNNFVNAMSQGLTIEGVAEAIMSSNEYYQVRGGGTDTGFVTALYQDVLQRAPDSGGLASWTGLLAKGVTRWQVAQGILLSNESERMTVTAAYNQFLNRDPDTAGLAGFVMLERHGMSTTDLYAAILASDEYFQMAQAL
jgi:hypothetical protein